MHFAFFQGAAGNVTLGRAGDCDGELVTEFLADELDQLGRIVQISAGSGPADREVAAQGKHAPLVCSAKTDAFSLALIIHLILSKGHHAFDRGNSSDIVQNIMAGYSVRPQQPFPPEVDKLFQAAFGYNQNSACLQATIDRRPSAADWMRVLLDAFNSLPA